MGSDHVVRQGEHASRIAEQYGFGDFRTIWDHPENAELKEKRQNPHVLFPTDRLSITEKEEGHWKGQTDQRHRFRLHRSRLVLRIVVENAAGEPVADTECRLVVEGQTHELTTDQDGRIEQQIPPSAERANLVMLGIDVPVHIGHLDPVEEISGCAGRLRNLGYYHGEIPVDDDKALSSAIEEFQCDHGLTVDGIPGPNTQSKLEDVHGC